jgi:anti-sigma B factor antagonist
MRHGELRVWTEEWDGTPVVRAEGEVDLGTVDALRKAASDIARRKPEAVIFDFRQVNYLDSTGLGVLVATRKKLGNSRDCIIIITNQPAVLQCLSLTGLDQVVRIQSEPSAVPTKPGP